MYFYPISAARISDGGSTSEIFYSVIFFLLILIVVLLVLVLILVLVVLLVVLLIVFVKHNYLLIIHRELQDNYLQKSSPLLQKLIFLFNLLIYPEKC